MDYQTLTSNNIAQLADDTIILPETFHSFKAKFSQTFEYSKKLYQVPNIDKTVYCHFSPNPSLEPIQMNEDTIISSVNANKGQISWHEIYSDKCVH